MKGIYKLTFQSEIYIGQAQDINKRYKDHLYKLHTGTHVPKLQEAYAKYGKPTLEILEYTDLLAQREAHYIAELKPTLNTVGIKSFIVEDKFTDKVYTSVLEQLIEKENFEHPSMEAPIVENIYVGASHRHLQYNQPILYNKLILAIKQRYQQKYIKNGLEFSRPEGVRLANILIAQPYKGWTQKYANCLISPTGVFIRASNVNLVCERFGLSSSAIQKVMKQKQLEHQGWKKLS